jgi:N-acetylglucosamine kinase-like BadF-type ATPase
MKIVLGVDAGNTKTIAIVAQEDGRILGWGRSGCGDIYGAGDQAALDAIAQAAHQALHASSTDADALSAVVLSTAGADWPEDFEAIRDGAIARGIGAHPIVYNDAIGGLRAGSPDGTGVGVACGTAAATGARSRDGRIWHSSFWQDAGGADQLGETALKAIVRAELGIAPRDPAMPLTLAFLRYLNLPTVEAMLHALTARDFRSPPQPEIKSMAKVVLDVAAEGEAMALSLVNNQGRALGDTALAAARKVGIEHEPFHLVLTGGVLRHPSALMRDAIIARVREASPSVNVIHDALEPALGAVMLALEHAHVAITPTVRAKLQMTAPPAKVFET